MLEGYRYIDILLGTGRDPFVYGGSQFLLEANHIVLCGTSGERRSEFRPHIGATERRFYEDHLCGADSFYAWVARSGHLKPSVFAARAYRRIVGQPQLFIEGNQRTATLIVSYVLGRAGMAPLVRTRSNAETFNTLSAACKAVDRRRFSSALRGRLLDRDLDRFIARASNTSFLLRAPPGRTEPEAERRERRALDDSNQTRPAGLDEVAVTSTMGPPAIR